MLSDNKSRKLSISMLPAPAVSLPHVPLHTRALTRSFTCTPLRAIARLTARLPARVSAHSHAHPLAYPRAYARTRALIRTLTRAPMRALARSPARSLARLCAHPPAHLRRMHAHLRAQDVATTWPNPPAYVLNLDNIYIHMNISIYHIIYHTTLY